MKICIQTKRLMISSRSIEEMQKLYGEEQDAEMKQAYLEMIEGMKDIVPYEEWACDWKICLKSGQQIGGIGFKGMPNDMGKIEVGYGIEVKYRNQGYATEALGAMLEWAFSQDGVQGVQAQTEDKNTISKKVLIKNGFMEVGVGTEGPLFERKNEKR